MQKHALLWLRTHIQQPLRTRAQMLCRCCTDANSSCLLYCGCAPLFASIQHLCASTQHLCALAPTDAVLHWGHPCVGAVAPCHRCTVASAADAQPKTHRCTSVGAIGAMACAWACAWARYLPRARCPQKHPNARTDALQVLQMPHRCCTNVGHAGARAWGEVVPTPGPTVMRPPRAMGRRGEARGALHPGPSTML